MKVFPRAQAAPLIACIRSAEKTQERAQTHRGLTSAFAWRRTACRIALAHGVTFAEVVSPGRTAKVFNARREIYAALKTEHGFSTTKIGQLIGGRDHSTVSKALSEAPR